MTRLVSTFPKPPQLDGLETVSLKDVSKFRSDDIWHIYETFEFDKMEKILSDKGMPSWIINDHWTTLKWPKTKDIFYCCNAWLGDDFDKTYRHLTHYSDIQTDHACVILVNKKQVNRYLALKLAELFQIDFAYTWSGMGRHFDLSRVIAELNQSNYGQWMTDSQRNFVLSPIELEQRWIEHPIEHQREHDSHIYNSRIGDYDFPWSNGLGKLSNRSAVHIITESVDYQYGSSFTEKTLYSLLALNFPIWVGGYGQADQWKNMGFDIFDDVINHSYQYHETLVERCWWAFVLNLEILQNKSLASELRQKHLPRLKNNRDLLLKNQLKQHAASVLDSWPEPIRSTGSLFIKKVYNIS